MLVIRTGRKEFEEDRHSLYCYGCGAPGVIKSKCPTCSKTKEGKATINNVNLYTFEAAPSPSSLILLKIFGTYAAVCADTGASHSIAGEKLYHRLRKEKVRFTPKVISLVLADGTKNNIEALSTVVDFNVEGIVVPTDLIVLPEAKGNKTVLGVDFLSTE